jgi:Spy/CpxP family protein refolding chaperone
MVKQQRIVLLAAGVAGVLVAAILLVGAVAEVAAQDGRGRPGFARGAGPGGLGLFGPGGAGIEGANLTEAQKDSVNGILDSHRVEMRGLLDRQAQARRVLAASAESGQVDEAAASEVGAASAALALAEARMRAEVFQLLTPEQRAAVQQHAAERAERFAARRGRQ